MTKRHASLFILFAAPVLAGLFSTLSCGGPKQEKAPDPVLGLVAIAGDGQNIVTWDIAKNATTYNLYWDTQPGVQTGTGVGAGTLVDGLKSTAYFHTGLTNGMTYYYVVTAVSEGGKESEAPASEVSATPRTIINCPASQNLCTDKCVDLQTDRKNCGACKNTCADTENCVAGVCQ